MSQTSHVLEVEYDLDTRIDRSTAAELFKEVRQFWAYGALLPTYAGGLALDLGQGATPLVELMTSPTDYGEVLLKMEGANPTGSFKDRYMAVAVATAAAVGEDRLVSTSTGNAGLALAAFAARAGLASLVLCPQDTPMTITTQLAAFGAQVVIVDWSQRTELMAGLAKHRSIWPIGTFMPGPFGNAFGVEGYKTFAYELHAQLGERIDAVVFPCARGNGLYGAWKGFRDLVSLGVRASVPRMIAVQPAGAASLAQSFELGTDEPVTIDAPHSLARSIREPVASSHTIRAIRSSEGTAIAVPDDEIVAAWRQLAWQGVSAELSSAAAVAGLARLRAGGWISPDSRTVCVVTSAGLKWPQDQARDSLESPIRLGEGTAALDSMIGAWIRQPAGQVVRKV